MRARRVHGTPIERFRAKVNMDGPVPENRPELGPCHIWTAGTDGHGYGAFRDGRVRPAHVWAYEQVHGPVPAGEELDHLCRRTLCVNVPHLEAVTYAENLRRGMSPSAIVARTGRCLKGHAMEGANVYRNPNGRGVECRQCGRDRERARRQRLSAVGA